MLIEVEHRGRNWVYPSLTLRKASPRYLEQWGFKRKTIKTVLSSWNKHKEIQRMENLLVGEKEIRGSAFPDLQGDGGISRKLLTQEWTSNAEGILLFIVLCMR